MPGLAKHAGAFWGGPDYGVLSWDNKLAGAQVSEASYLYSIMLYLAMQLPSECY
jgi:hypothetical protein